MYLLLTNGYSLTLPARQHTSTLPNVSLILLRQFLDELMCVCGHTCSLDERKLVILLETPKLAHVSGHISCAMVYQWGGTPALLRGPWEKSVMIKMKLTKDACWNSVPTKPLATLSYTVPLKRTGSCCFTVNSCRRGKLLSENVPEQAVRCSEAIERSVS